MASYFVKYNDVNLTNMIRVRAVNTTVLPPRENNAITIWERPGGIYNSYRYGEREITITFLVMVSKEEYRNNPNSIDSKLNNVASAFKVDEPKPLYIGSESKYINAVPEGEFKLTELRYDCYECEVMFVCYDPQYYSSSAKTYSNKSSSAVRALATTNNNNQFDAYNAGTAPTYPIINIGINKDNTSFVQLENLTNGNKILLGNHLKTNSPTKPAEVMIFNDEMKNMTKWGTASSSDIDADRSVNGSLKLTSYNHGFMINNVGSGSTTWKGAGTKKQLREALTDFSVQIRMNHNSTGKDGDPTEKTTKQEQDLDYSLSGKKTTFYKVMAPSLEVRESANVTAKIIGNLEKGTNIEVIGPSSIVGGWVKTSFNGQPGYCYASNLKKYISDPTETVSVKNVVTRDEIELRSAPTYDNTSSLLATIPARTPLRVYKTKENGFYKLYISYNGYIGYINEEKVTDYSGGVEYPEDEVVITNDNKTGVCELYGWAANGTKLFKLSLSDDNEYYEYTKPAIQIGSNTVLEDNSSVPTPNKIKNYSEQLTVTHDYLSDGSSVNWNEFYGELGIQRKNGKWQAWIYKIEDGSTVKKLTFKEQEVVDSPEGDLEFISIYIGTKDSQNISGMSVSDIKVKSLNTYDLSTQNVTRFNKGDKIKIDCHNNKVYLNDQLYYDVGVGSDFIEIITGNNVMKVVSDDPDVIATVIFNERYL